MKELVLIDGNSIMNRAFYGIMGSKMKGPQTVGRVSLPPFLSRTRKEVARRGDSRPPPVAKAHSKLLKI